MKLRITDKAKGKLLEMAQVGKNKCFIYVKKGGCFGYHTEISFNIIEDVLDATAEMLIEGNDESATVVLIDKFNLETEYKLDYVETMVKSGFEVRVDMNGCCCNKSFGNKISLNECINKI